VSTTGSASAAPAGYGCLNAVFDFGGGKSGRRRGVFGVSAAGEGLGDHVGLLEDWSRRGRDVEIHGGGCLI